MSELNPEWVEAGARVLRAQQCGLQWWRADDRATVDAEAVLAAVVPLIKAQWEQVGWYCSWKDRFIAYVAGDEQPNEKYAAVFVEAWKPQKEQQ